MTTPGGAADPRLSMVLACDGALDQLADRITALERACRGIDAEIIVARAIDTQIALPSSAIPLRVVTGDSSLVPALWGAGIAAARAPVVALTTTQFRVRENWARALLVPFADAGVMGAGGSMEVAPSAGMLTRAVFLIRYSE